MAQLVKLPCEREDLSSSPRTHIKQPSMVVHGLRHWDSLASQLADLA